MGKEVRPDTKRGEVSFIFAIVIGLLIGILIKRVRIGILIGMVLGLIIIFTGLLRNNRK